MILKSNKLLYGAFFLCLPSIIFADLTTLQSWDPDPVFNAANLDTPPDTQFCTIIKRQILEDNQGKRRRIGVNFSPFVQRAIRAQAGPNQFYGDYALGTDSSGNSLPKPAGTEMSDYQGTPFLMGLFLGADQNGHSIWKNNIDTGVTTNITGYDTLTHIKGTVDSTLLPANLQDAILSLNNNTNTNGSSASSAIIYGDSTNFDPSTGQALGTSPSILSQSVLEQDDILFGAMSIPLVYQKAGIRWEFNFDINDNFGLILRGGACQISQLAGTPIPLSAVIPATPGAAPTIYSQLSNTANASTGSNIAPSGTVGLATAQALFNEWVTNNVDDLLDAENGANYDISTFTASGLEDARFLFFMRHTFATKSEEKLEEDQEEKDEYSPMLITPYAIVGCTVPLSPQRDFSKIYSLSFGNNGHLSAGGIVGITFDFLDSVEIGFNGGATFFVPKEIDNMPCPNHELQRVFYPYRRNFIVKPGCNWHFGANLNAVDFIKNVSFLFTYNFIQHTQDSIIPVNGSIGNEYFFPSQLEELSPWASQMFTAALDFKLQPGIFLSLAWQSALSQTNAYCSSTILGSLNFLF